MLNTLNNDQQLGENIVLDYIHLKSWQSHYISIYDDGEHIKMSVKENDAGAKRFIESSYEFIKRDYPDLFIGWKITSIAINFNTSTTKFKITIQQDDLSKDLDITPPDQFLSEIKAYFKDKYILTGTDKDIIDADNSNDDEHQHNTTNKTYTMGDVITAMRELNQAMSETKIEARKTLKTLIYCTIILIGMTSFFAVNTFYAGSDWTLSRILASFFIPAVNIAIYLFITHKIKESIYGKN